MTTSKSTPPQRKKGTRYFFIYGYAVLCLLILASVSTYAWLLLTRTPRVSNLSVYINTFSGMELSLTPDDESGWSGQLSYEELFPESYELRPATWSEKDQTFYGANYTALGKLRDDWDLLTEAENANSTTATNYYCVASFYARTDTKMQVSLAPAVEVNDGLGIAGTYLMGSPTWNADEVRHDNGGNGAEYAIRIGINVIRLNEELLPTGEEELYIYEPNASYHADGTYGYVPTSSVDGTPTIIDEEHIITQSVSRWGEVEPVLHDTLQYHAGSFLGETRLFVMEAKEIVQIKLIIWLEGRDIDCTNAIADASVFANLQFDAQTIGGGGLVPIP